jgi:hypothetical protein
LNVYLVLGLWDLQGWARLDAFKAAPIQNEIEEDRLMRWMQRAEKFVDIMESSFPNTCTFWRILHPCKVPSFPRPALMMIAGRLGDLVPRRCT